MANDLPRAEHVLAGPMWPFLFEQPGWADLFAVLAAMYGLNSSFGGISRLRIGWLRWRIKKTLSESWSRTGLLVNTLSF
ncbi:hypothetical protein [Mycolicibacter icosiumassiliensis]|uniref:hypothetical protein n=1 Tax=Mycolicibacter icosiumassiliensis TaxID=1792835 RepID=UPI0012B69EC0|nr:hypothetical protein [Mycolicibacter icosiumassiliensis]